MNSVTLDSGLGTISFDGQVLEVFGFGEQGSRRIHVAQIRQVELRSAGALASLFAVDVGPAAVGLKMAMKLSENDRAGLEALVEAIRAAGTEASEPGRSSDASS